MNFFETNFVKNLLTFLFDFYTHYRPILRRLATIHNAAGRQTDRQTDKQIDGNRPPMLQHRRPKNYSDSGVIYSMETGPFDNSVALIGGRQQR